jgi:hypothetical protein
VLGSTYGSLPELVPPEVGVLSNSRSELIASVADLGRFDRKRCHEYVCDSFSAGKMARDYLALYEKVINGEQLNLKQPVSQLQEPAELLPIYD